MWLSIVSCGKEELTSPDLVIDTTIKTIDISPKIPEVLVYNDSLTVIEFTARAFDDNENIIEDVEFEWITSDPNLATVNSDGLVNFLDYGLVTITATADDLAGETQINIIEPPSLEFLSMPISSIGYNQEYYFRPRILSQDGEGIISFDNIPSWLTLDESTGAISGVPGWERLDQVFPMEISATNDVTSISISININVFFSEVNCHAQIGDPSESLYILPYEVGESFVVGQSYCPSNPNWGHHMWFAYDFTMPIGTNIIAMRAGEVIATREHNVDGNRTCGTNGENFVFILHDDGTVATYIHLTLNGALVEVGDSVTQGQLIGISGDTGCSAGPHTHIAIFRQRGNYTRKYTLPFNYSNSEGTLDARNGLMMNQSYKALPF